MSAHPSALVIDALAAGLSDDAAARAHVESCARCRADLAAAQAACAQFTRDVLPRTIDRLGGERHGDRLGGERHGDRLGGERHGAARPRWFQLAWLLPAFAAAALVFWLVRHPESGVTDDDVRAKGGGITFQVFAHRGDEVFAVRDGTRLAAGDQIRFVVGSGGPAYLLVVSVDGAGRPSVYYPYGGERSGPVAKEPSELPGSIVLDAAPGPERVFALISSEPVDAAAVAPALAALGARGAGAIRTTRTLDVPAAAQASVVFEKLAKAAP